MQKNNVLPIIGIYAGLDEELAHLVEMELIAKFGRKDTRKGSLLNLTDGGEGVKGLIQSKETIQKRVQSINYGPRTEEVKIKISNTKRGNTVAWNKGKSGVQTYTSRPREIVDKIASRNRGTKRTAEQKQRMSEAQKKRFMDPEQRNAISLARRKKFNNATQRENNGQ
jgi:hypothetical protein